MYVAVVRGCGLGMWGLGLIVYRSQEGIRCEHYLHLELYLRGALISRISYNVLH